MKAAAGELRIWLLVMMISRFQGTPLLGNLTSKEPPLPNVLFMV
jgi:hypothetical protein